MSRRWKPNPTHLPGWPGYDPHVDPPRAQRHRKAHRHDRHARKALKPKSPFPPFEFPQLERTLIITEPDGFFRGSATYWKRRNGWECVGALKPVIFLVDLPIFESKHALERRGLTCRWLPAKIPDFSRRSLRPHSEKFPENKPSAVTKPPARLGVNRTSKPPGLGPRERAPASATHGVNISAAPSAVQRESAPAHSPCDLPANPSAAAAVSPKGTALSG